MRIHKEKELIKALLQNTPKKHKTLKVLQNTIKIVKSDKPGS